MSLKPLLQLHFDVNGTIILQDAQIGKKDVAPIVKCNFAKMAIVSVKDGKPLWNGDTDWRNWGSDSSKEKGQSTLERYWLSNPNLLAEFSKQDFYLNFYESQMAEAFSEVLNELLHKYSLLEGKEKDHRILPSFFCLISHLIEQNRHFNVIIRTYGPMKRVGKLVEEINDFFSNNHANCEVFLRDGDSIELHSHRILSTDNLGVLHRDNDGSLLSFGQLERPPNAIQWGKTFYKENHEDKPNTSSPNVVNREYVHYVNPEQDERNGRKFFKEVVANGTFYDGHREIFAKFKEATVAEQTLIVRDDFPWWKANNEETHCGKPVIVDREDRSIHPIFFDDNIMTHSQDLKIADVIDIASEQKLDFVEANQVFVICANTLLALEDDQYFIKMVDLCEENRAAS